MEEDAMPQEEMEDLLHDHWEREFMPQILWEIAKSNAYLQFVQRNAKKVMMDNYYIGVH